VSKPNPKMFWTDGRNNPREREVNQLIDARDYLGTPGYSLLLVAANTHLSVADIEMWLQVQSRTTPFVGRSLSWIQRHRWLFQQPNTDNTKNPEPNLDGKAAKAIEVMRANPKLSLRDLAVLLNSHGIKRGREWIRRHRCDEVTPQLPI
jgi:hypothetical protein